MEQKLKKKANENYYKKINFICVLYLYTNIMFPEYLLMFFIIYIVFLHSNFS